MKEQPQPVPKPHDPAAEQGVLSVAIIHGADAVASLAEVLAPEDFYLPAHGQIWRAILALFEAGQPIDEITVESWLQAHGLLERVGGQALIMGLSDLILAPAHGDHYAQLVADKAKVRAFMDACAQAYRSVASANGDTASVIEQAAGAIYAANTDIGKGGLVPIRQSLMATLKGLEHRKRSGLSTGIPALDEATGGLEAPDLVILAARPSVGKTALACQIARAVAGNKNPVAFFSLEMSREQVNQRLISTEARVDMHALRTRKFRADQLDDITMAADVLAGLPLHVDDSAALTTLQIRSRARKMAAREGLALVVVDYLQLVRNPGRDNREQEVAEVSRSLKAMAKDLSVPVLALCQLNRKIEDRGAGATPRLSDLRESGGIEQDADGIWFIHRPNLKDAAAELVIGKQRNGPCAELHMYFNGSLTTFAERTDADGRYGE